MTTATERTAGVDASPPAKPAPAWPLAALAGGVALVVVLAPYLMAPGDYRAAALPLVERAQELLDVGPRRALAGPELPLPVLVTSVGEALVGDPVDPLRAPALGGALALAAAAALTVLAAGQVAGLFAAAAAALLFILCPGVLYHARTLGPEASHVLAASLLLHAALLARGPRSAEGGPLAGGAGPLEPHSPARRNLALALLGGLALAASALSTWYGVFLFLAWPVMVVLARPVEPLRGEPATGHSGTWRLPPVPLAAFAALALGAALLLAWPHLATETGKRLLALLHDPMRLPHPPTLAAGHIYDQAVGAAPPFLVGLVAVVVRFPAVLCLLAAIGLRAPAGRPAAVAAGAHALVLALNGGPGHLGLDAALALLPFLVFLAALGAARVASHRVARVAALVACLSPVVGLIRTAPVEPAFRSELLLGRAASSWDTLPAGTLPSPVVEWMGQSLPQGARVAFEPDAAAGPLRELFDALVRRGVLRRDLGSAAPYHATHGVFVRRPGGTPPAQAPLSPGGPPAEPLFRLELGGIPELVVAPY